MRWALVGMCTSMCWSAVRAGAKTHVTEPRSTANNVDIAQRIRPANLRHKPLSNLRVSSHLPYILKVISLFLTQGHYRVVGKSLARPGRKQATATEDFEFHIS